MPPSPVRSYPDRRAHATIESFVAAAPVAYQRPDLSSLFSRRAFDGALRRGALVRLLPGAYVGANHAHDLQARCDAALLWSGDRAAIASTSAALLHGLRVRTPLTVTITVDRATHLRPPPWVRVLRWTVPPELTTARGLPCVSLADAVLQAWADLPDDEGVSLILEAVRSGRIPVAALRARASTLPRIRRRRALGRLLDHLANGLESFLEHVAVTRVFNTCEFSGLRPQTAVEVSGRRYRLDLFHADARLAIELDGRQFHSDDSARRRDLARDADLATLGIATIRLTFEDVIGRPDWCRDRVRRAISARARRRMEARGRARPTARAT
jgi:very-short-patch-repair endonuclease